MIDQQPDVELGARQLRDRGRLEPFGSAARAIATASIASDLPESRAAADLRSREGECGAAPLGGLS